MFIRYSYKTPVPFSLKGVQRNLDSFIGLFVHYSTAGYASFAAYQASSEASRSALSGLTRNPVVGRNPLWFRHQRSGLPVPPYKNTTTPHQILLPTGGSSPAYERHSVPYVSVTIKPARITAPPTMKASPACSPSQRTATVVAMIGCTL